MRTMSIGPLTADKMIVSVKESELETIAKKSLRNCHVFGVDSVMFDDTPGRRVRAFVAYKNHEMWMNLGKHLMSVAWHPHHCDIALLPVFGDTFNVTPFRVAHGGEKFSPYLYQSQILSGIGGFKSTRMFKALQCISVATRMDGLIQMRAKDLHTVFVPKSEESAWYVFEKKEDTTYIPISWSNADLAHCDFSRLYKPMTVERLRENIAKLNIQIE